MALNQNHPSTRNLRPLNEPILWNCVRGFTKPTGGVHADACTNSSNTPPTWACGFAPNLETLFAEAAACLFSAVLEEIGSVRAVQAVTVEVAGTDREFLLFDWLANCS